MSVETKGDISISVDNRKLSGLSNKVIVWSPNEKRINTQAIDRAVEIITGQGLYHTELDASRNSGVKFMCWRRRLPNP